MINKKDIYLSPEGDFGLTDSGDIRLTKRDELAEQKINIALKTTNPDWGGELIAADLEDLIGMPHTKETVEIGKRKIKKALTQHGFFDPKDVYVEAKPGDKSTIIFILYVNMPFAGQAQIYNINLDLGSGAEIRRIA